MLRSALDASNLLRVGNAGATVATGATRSGALGVAGSGFSSSDSTLSGALYSYDADPGKLMISTFAVSIVKIEVQF